MFRRKSSGSYYSFKGIKSSLKAGSRFNGSFMVERIRTQFYFVVDFARKYWIVLLGAMLGMIVAFILIIVNDFKRVKALTHFQPSITTKVYDKHGVLISELFRQKREVVPITDIPDQLVNAFVAMEDNEYYEHYGVNPKGIVRAFFVNLMSGRIRQGGSTITQQLAKILLTSRKRTIFRKVKEACIALMIEMTYSKKKIMELYLNQIYLGHGAYGVETAAKLYFDKQHVRDLNLAECALLATLPSAPNRLSPFKDRKTSMRMHRVALARMVEIGAITVKEAEDAYLNFWPDYLMKISDKPPTITAWSSKIDRAPWFTEYVRRILVKKYGEDTVYKKGLLVYTTLDLKKQEAAQRTMTNALAKQSSTSFNLSFRNEDYIMERYASVVEMFSLLFDMDTFSRKGSFQNKKINDYFQDQLLDELEGVNFMVGLDPVGELCQKYKTLYLKDKDFQGVEGALVTINHKTGYIEAMVGGSSFTSINQLNRAMQAYRQPGSSIKPLLYTAAMNSRKFTPATTILDSPVIYLDNEGGDWIPENYENEYYGLERLRSALSKSINVVSIKIAEELGIDTVIQYYAKFLKLSNKEKERRIPRNFSIALGSVEVSPYELARAYGTIANGGREVIPFAIRKVVDRNNKVLENREEEVKEKLNAKRKKGTLQVVDAAAAQIMISMLRSVMSSGTGLYASIGRPAGGKTGTTNNWRDAWFVGFTPDITTCIWMGYDQPGRSLGIGQSGGSVTAPVWGAYMKEAVQGSPVRNFPTYAHLVEADVCAKTGLLAGPNCPRILKEVFIPGTVPEKECDLCVNAAAAVDLQKKGPKENIVEKQDKQILKQIKKNTDNSSILDNIGEDLLD